MAKKTKAAKKPKFDTSFNFGANTKRKGGKSRKGNPFAKAGGS